MLIGSEIAYLLKIIKELEGKSVWLKENCQLGKEKVLSLEVEVGDNA